MSESKRDPQGRPQRANSPHPTPDTSSDEDTGSSRVELAREAVGELLSRYRRQLLPFAAVGVTCVLGLAAAAAPGWWPLAFAGAGLVLAIGGTTAAAHKAARVDARFAAAGSAGLTGWLAVSLLTGPYGPMMWMLWLGGYTAAVPYWMRHTDPDPDTAAERAAPVPPAAPAPEPEKPSWQAQRWGQYLASGKNAPFPRSKLVDVTTIDHGWRATADLGRTGHWSELTKHLNVITSVFDQEDGRVIPEPIPGEPVYRPRITVITDNPLQRVTPWTGPGLDPAGGTFPLMLSADGEKLHWRLWWPGAGSTHGLIAGAQGSGKSACLNLILSEVAASDRLYPVLIDGNGGMSIPDWLEHAPHTATTPLGALETLQWVDNMRSARAEHFARKRWTDEKGRGRTGVPFIDPTSDTPGIVVVIDEAPVLLKGNDTINKELRELVTRLAQMGRKTAITVILVTQQPSITELGNSSALRGQLKANNVLSFRTSERADNGMLVTTPLPEPLNMLPETWPDGSFTKGLGYFLSQRPIRARTFLHDDPYGYAELLAGKQLDAVSASVPAPVATGDGTATHQSQRPVADLRVTTSGTDATGTVRAAVDAGCARDVMSIVNHTGLSVRQARDALNSLN